VIAFIVVALDNIVVVTIVVVGVIVVFVISVGVIIIVVVVVTLNGIARSSVIPCVREWLTLFEGIEIMGGRLEGSLVVTCKRRGSDV